MASNRSRRGRLAQGASANSSFSKFFLSAKRTRSTISRAGRAISPVPVDPSTGEGTSVALSSVCFSAFQKRGNCMLLYHFAQAFAGTVAILWVILILKERVKGH